jgi:general secretion pathway protein C
VIWIEMEKVLKTIFNLIVLTVVIYAGVDIFYRTIRSELIQIDTQDIAIQQLLKSEPEKRFSLSDYRPITERNIFGSIDQTIKDVNMGRNENAGPTSLKLVLLGTVTGNEQNAYAVIEETKKGKQGLYVVGDSVQNATVKMILKGKVILRVQDNDEVLSMIEFSSDESGTGRRLSGTDGYAGSTVTVRRSELRRALGDIKTLLSQVQVQPHFTDGRADGLVLVQIERGSIFSRLGLKDGDVVREINGRAVRSAEDILESYHKFRSKSSSRIAIIRDNKLKTINYRFR